MHTIPIMATVLDLMDREARRYTELGMPDQASYFRNARQGAEATDDPWGILWLAGHTEHKLDVQTEHALAHLSMDAPWCRITPAEDAARQRDTDLRLWVEAVVAATEVTRRAEEDWFSMGSPVPPWRLTPRMRQLLGHAAMVLSTVS